jgi:hypothetical protein
MVPNPRSPRRRAQDSSAKAKAAAALREDTSPIYASAALLDNWTSHDWSEGIDLTRASSLVTLEIVTRRSIYYVVRSGPGELMIKGGHYLPDFRRARSVGCSMGGALLKQHAIHIGFRMEIAFEDMRLVTSEVTHVRVLTEATE